MEYKYTGIVLGKKDVGETDRIYTIYTLEGGKIRSVAKGVRKPEAKLAASLENFIYADITIARSRGLGKIAGSIIEHSYPNIRKSGQCLLDAMKMMRIFDRLVDLEHADQNLFNLLKKYFETLDECALLGKEDKMQIVHRGFAIKMLDFLGYTLEVSSCVFCQSALSPEKIYFSVKHGGVLCEKCQGNDQHLYLVSKEAVKLMRIFLQSDIVNFSKISLEQKYCDEVDRISADFLKWIG